MRHRNRYKFSVCMIEINQARIVRKLYIAAV